MNQQQDQLATLHEIRNIMDRSSRFISLSGLSGVAAGVSALIGAAVVKWYLVEHNINYSQTLGSDLTSNNLLFLVAVAALVFILAFCSATYFTARNAKKNSHRVWDSKTERLLVNLFIPVAAGGIFCAILIYHDLLYLVAPVMLLFYGCGLLNASKYTLSDIRYLGLFEIILGLAASFFVGYGLIAWTLGFGVLHIVYGVLVYYKYER
ncbi:membrane protein [Pontibacter sp. HJ8]